MDGKGKRVLTITSEASEDDEMDGEKMEEQEGKTKKKKKKKKKKSTTDVTPQPVKKSKEMLTLDFGDMLTKMMVKIYWRYFCRGAFFCDSKRPYFNNIQFFYGVLGIFGDKKETSYSYGRVSTSSSPTASERNKNYQET